MRKGTIAVLVALAFVFSLAVAFAAEKPPEVVVLKGPTKGAVKFTHKKHAEEMKIACTECHHVIKDGKNVWKEGDPVQKCETCHKLEAKPGEKPMSLKEAFHQNCWKGCHVEEKKAGKKAPTMCNQCHETPAAK
jgi:hypothetical protein